MNKKNCCGTKLENYSERKMKNNNFIRTYPHSVNPKNFPKLPLEINSEKQHSIIKEIIKNNSKLCNSCQEKEKQFVQLGKDSLINLEKNNYKKPILEENVKNNCKICQLLLQTWNRYFTILETIQNYLLTKKLPPEPKMKLICNGCKDINEKCKNYSRNLLKELDCVKSTKLKKSCNHTPIQKGYNYNKDCQNCEKVFNEWQMYIFPIVGLVNYYRFSSI